MDDPNTEFDWSLTTWEGSRRAQLRRWCTLTLRERFQTVEEMANLARHFAQIRTEGRFRDSSSTSGDSAAGVPRQPDGTSRPATGGIRERPGKYGDATAGPETPEPDKGSDDAEG